MSAGIDVGDVVNALRDVLDELERTGINCRDHDMSESHRNHCAYCHGLFILKAVREEQGYITHEKGGEKS